MSPWYFLLGSTWFSRGHTLNNLVILIFSFCQSIVQPLEQKAVLPCLCYITYTGLTLTDVLLNGLIIIIIIIIIIVVVVVIIIISIITIIVIVI